MEGKREARSGRRPSHLGVLKNFVLLLRTFTSQSPGIQDSVEGAGGWLFWNGLGFSIDFFVLLCFLLAGDV